MKILPPAFYQDRPDRVARRLLGKKLVRIYSGRRLSGVIVETEAYFGPEDPASRARRGGNLARVMASQPGTALVYGIHRQWLLNVVAHQPGGVGAVLIRAIQPLEGLDVMKRLRGVDDPRLLTNGPGKLTKALAVDKSFHGKPLYTRETGLWLEEYMDVPENRLARSRRIGVTEDLEKPYRFYVVDSPYVSVKKRRSSVPKTLYCVDSMGEKR